MIGSKTVESATPADRSTLRQKSKVLFEMFPLSLIITALFVAFSCTAETTDLPAPEGPTVEGLSLNGTQQMLRSSTSFDDLSKRQMSHYYTHKVIPGEPLFDL